MDIKGRTPIPVPGYENTIDFGILVYFAYPIENSSNIFF